MLAGAALVLVAGSLLTGPARGSPWSGQPAADSADAIGTLRNARIAHAIPAGSKEKLVFFASDISDAQLAELKAVAPNVQIVRGLDRRSAVDRAAEADGVDASLVSPEFLAKASRLTWVHAPSAGVDRLVPMKGIADNPGLVVTNNRAVHGPAIADQAMAMLLSLTRQLPYYARAQSEARWDHQDPPARPVVLEGKTMLVVGIGGIGTEIAKRAHGMGMHVIATRRSDTPAPEFVERVGKPDQLREMIPGADVVAICTPLTAETAGLFDAGMLSAMKRGAYLINIARGKIVDTTALLAALNDGRLAGACLDVTDPEPLPPEHPLWKAKNVIITPHVAAEGELTDQRRWTLLKENIRRFGAGEPLMNCVDVKAGY